MEKSSLVEKAREIYKDIPIDSSSLETYVKLMELQENLQGRFLEKYTDVDIEKITSLMRENTPAFLAVDLGLDEEELGETLKAITGMLKKELPDTAKSLERLEQAWDDKELSMVQLGESLLQGEIAYAYKKAEELGVDPEILEAVAAWVIQVLFQALEKKISEKTDFSEWKLGRCPVCGGTTRLEYIDELGATHLKCQFCGAEWNYPNGKCPNCGNDQAQGITVIPTDENKRFTLNICHECGMYWKVVDERVVGHDIPRKLYDLWTFKLDLIASGEKNRQ
ncbi:MAG: formate dehydrogenase accessory protein FdhE [Infirmifilum sp.]